MLCIGKTPELKYLYIQKIARLQKSFAKLASRGSKFGLAFGRES